MNSNRNNDDAVLHDLSPKGKRVSAARYHTSKQARNDKSNSRSSGGSNSRSDGSNGTEHGRAIDEVVTEGQPASLNENGNANGNVNVNMNPLPPQQQQQQQKGGIISDESSHGDHCDEDTNHSTTTSSTTSTPEGIEREGQGDGNVAQGRGGEGEYTTRSSNSSSRTTDRKSTSSRRRLMTGRVLEPMTDIVQSPYEKNGCAEVNEACFETLKSLMEPPLQDDEDEEDEDEEDPSVEHDEERRKRKKQHLQVQRDRLFGDVLARILYQAYGEIQHSGLLFSNTWREGKIRQLNLGWIPKRQLLICLSPEHFAEAETAVLQAVIKNLDCVALLMEALTRYHFSSDYPKLASHQQNKEHQNLVFVPEAHKPRCFKCVLFVARAYATMENLQLAQHPSASLTKKMRRCLSILNEHVRPNQAALTRLLTTLRKKKRIETEAARSKMTTTTTTELWRKKKKKRDRRSASTPSSVTTHTTGHHHKRVVALASSITDHPSCAGREDTSRAHKKIRRHHDHHDHSSLPAESMLVSFQILREQMERMNHLVEHYGTQLYGHRESLQEEDEEEEERTVAGAAGETTRVRQDPAEDEVEGEEEDNY